MSSPTKILEKDFNPIIRDPNSEKDLLAYKVSQIKPDQIISQPKQQENRIIPVVAVIEREIDLSQLRNQAIEAIQEGDYKLLLEVLGKVPSNALGGFLNTPDPKGNMLLLQCVSAKKGNIHCMNILLDAGANYSQVDSRGNNFVHLAIWHGSAELLESFLERVPLDHHQDLIRTKDKFGYTPLLQCAMTKSGNFECLRTLLKIGAAHDDETSRNGDNFVHLAIKEGHSDLLGSYLRSLSEEDARKMVNTPDKKGNLPLLQCLIFANKNPEIMKLLCKAGADYRATNANGQNFVHMAVREGHFELLESFLNEVSPEERAALVNARDKKGNTPLFECCNAKTKGTECMKLLLKAGADPLVLNKEGDSPYHAALYHRKDELARLLLQKEPRVEGLVIPNFLGHVFGFNLQPTFKGEKISNGSHAFLMHKEIADDLQKEGVRAKSFSDCSSNQYEELVSAFVKSAVKEPTSEEIAQTVADIQAGKLMVISSGWKGHAITHVFKNGYLVTCNRGNGAGEKGTFFAHKIDPSQMTVEVLRKLVKKEFSQKDGLVFYYDTLPNLLKATKDEVCGKIQEVSPKLSKSGVCGYAAGKAALRAALALSTGNPQLAKTMSKSWATGHRERTLARFQRTPSPLEETVRDEIFKKQIKRRLDWRASGKKLSTLRIPSTEESPSSSLSTPSSPVAGLSPKQGVKEDVMPAKRKRIAALLLAKRGGK